MNILTYLNQKKIYSNTKSSAYKSVEDFYKSTTLSTTFGYINGINPSVEPKLIQEVEFTSTDFTFGLQLDEYKIGFKEVIHRAPSCRLYSAEKISFQTIMQAIKKSLVANRDGRREYSSAGGLYAVEVFIAIDTTKLTELPREMKTGFYYINSSNASLVKVSVDVKSPISQYLCIKSSPFNQAAFQLITMINIPKSIFKYEERGYRNSLIEVGSIHHIVREAFQKLGVDSCECSEFSDIKLLRAMNLNGKIFFPALVQHFGMSIC